jgi:hypothetical protein
MVVASLSFLLFLPYALLCLGPLDARLFFFCLFLHDQLLTGRLNDFIIVGHLGLLHQKLGILAGGSPLGLLLIG